MPSTEVSERPTVHQLKIELRGLRPPVWRRVRVPSRLSLGGLHEVIQVLFGWDGMHLHAFEDGRHAAWGPHRDPLGGALDSGWDDEDGVALADVLPRAGGRLSYTYDLGDDWEHRITVEEVRPAGPDEAGYAVCTGGRRALPDCEDVGGVWALQELLERYEAGERPEPVTEEDGEPEYDSHADYVLARMFTTGFDPARLDVAELSGALERLPLVTVDGVSAAGEQDGRFPCPSCGEWHPLPDEDGAELGDLITEALDPDSRVAPAIRLPDDAELARQVRGAEHFMAAVRLGHWCGAGRELTPKGVLRPKLARQAVEEAELWRAAPDEWGDAAERRRRLAGIRSAADMEPVRDPWEWALLAGFVEVSGDGKKASSGDALPDEQDDAAVLAAWQETLAGTVADVFAELPEPVGMLRLMSGLDELLAQAPPVGFGLLLHCYGLPEGEWADASAFFDEALDDLPDDAAGELLSALYMVQWEEAAELLVRFGAAEYRPEDSPPGDEQDGDWLLIGLSAPAPGRFRLTPLGRAGLRRLLVEAGVMAPVVGRMERAEAAELLAALATYRSAEEVRAEVVGWLAARTPADAAVQLVDACGGTEGADALRRLMAPLVLEHLLPAQRPGESDSPEDTEPDQRRRVRAVLRKAAASGVPGCAHTAASWLRRIGDPAEGQDAYGREWMCLDGLYAYADGGPEAVRARLEQGPGAGRGCGEQVAELADDLWRAGHPHGEAVLTAVADSLVHEDKQLAKRLRKAAFKARSAT
ncbi:plasmid pRiA4b ORF-3 family protein [Streptomyces sp. TRM68367]|uniref:plasmid pRiA4b ORF-3 family protein n=1 Tax=Streptomyces sp. TRM68367 TaxID=2758415 RepID=UPI00165BD68A|nr:plasmid pRiA4b ORF-3 family protein [Streptomyces sp. TRM68367]MBC9727591.1 plasmid pRiA4b ORF-3 family protein [Streptomyces sp. TRM68367]